MTNENSAIRENQMTAEKAHELVMKSLLSPDLNDWAEDFFRYKPVVDDELITAFVNKLRLVEERCFRTKQLERKQSRFSNL